MIFLLLEGRGNKTKEQEWRLESFSSISRLEHSNMTPERPESGAGLWHKYKEFENKILVDMQANKRMGEKMDVTT